eukprot:759091-Hanusia_phi.AAC.2
MMLQDAGGRGTSQSLSPGTVTYVARTLQTLLSHQDCELNSEVSRVMAAQRLSYCTCPSTLNWQVSRPGRASATQLATDSGTAACWAACPACQRTLAGHGELSEVPNLTF